MSAGRCSFQIALCVLSVSAAFAQEPQITPGGVVSAASYASPIAPGELISIFGTNFSTGAPGGTTVTINGVPAPISALTPTQINPQVPLQLQASLNSGVASVVITTPAGSSQPALVPLADAAPGFFTADGSGCGQVSALNVRPDGSTSVNSPVNSAAPGDYVALFGTGFGAASAGGSMLQTPPLLFLDDSYISSLAYAGLAPGLTGVDQVNFQLRTSVRNGCSVPVLATQSWPSQSVTIAVQNGRGRCADPPIQSYGMISVGKNLFYGPFSTQPTGSENFYASFPAGPKLQPPPPETISFAPNWDVEEIVGPFAYIALGSVDLRTCVIPGYSDLSAGTIKIQPASGAPVTVPPQPLGSIGVAYAAPLPDGFMVPGRYTITGTPGNAVTLNATLAVGSPIQITTAFPSGTAISDSQPLTVKWTGGDSGSLVRVALVSQTGPTALIDYSYAAATAGMLTMQPKCAGGVCSFGLPLSENVSVQVAVVPASPDSVQVPGVTGQVQLYWQYAYSFFGLTLAH